MISTGQNLVSWKKIILSIKIWKTSFCLQSIEIDVDSRKSNHTKEDEFLIGNIFTFFETQNFEFYFSNKQVLLASHVR